MHFNSELIHKTKHLTHFFNLRQCAATEYIIPCENSCFIFSLLWRFFSSLFCSVLFGWLRFCSMFDSFKSCGVLRLSLLQPLKRFGCTYELLRRWWWIMDSIFLSHWLLFSSSSISSSVYCPLYSDRLLTIQME